MCCIFTCLVWKFHVQLQSSGSVQRLAVAMKQFGGPDIIDHYTSLNESGTLSGAVPFNHRSLGLRYERNLTTDLLLYCHQKYAAQLAFSQNQSLLELGQSKPTLGSQWTRALHRPGPCSTALRSFAVAIHHSVVSFASWSCSNS